MDNRRKAWTASDISRMAPKCLVSHPSEISSSPAHTLQTCRLPTRLLRKAAADLLLSFLMKITLFRAVTLSNNKNFLKKVQFVSFFGRFMFALFFKMNRMWKLHKGGSH